MVKSSTMDGTHVLLVAPMNDGNSWFFCVPQLPTGTFALFPTCCVRSVRCCGSCAMNLVGVACGRLDAFYEIGFGGCWDVAAGASGQQRRCMGIPSGFYASVTYTVHYRPPTLVQ